MTYTTCGLKYKRPKKHNTRKIKRYLAASNET